MSKAYSKFRLWAKRQLHKGQVRFCPVCSSNLSHFQPTGVERRSEALCPVCNAYERHRLIWLYFQRCTDLFSPPHKKMLHVAPEPFFADRLQQNPYLIYISGDLFDSRVMTHLDINRLPYPDQCFDIIYASHVLEHIPDDRQAMRELVRVLKPGGWAILQVPLDPERTITYEDFSIIAPEAREKAFGQRDHVRIYGLDYWTRLQEAGFQVKIDKFIEQLDQAEISRFGLMATEDVYFCSKEKSSLQKID
jgi:SAM-dependent methyltransferase